MDGAANGHTVWIWRKLRSVTVRFESIQALQARWRRFQAIKLEVGFVGVVAALWQERRDTATPILELSHYSHSFPLTQTIQLLECFFSNRWRKFLGRFGPRVTFWIYLDTMLWTSQCVRGAKAPTPAAAPWNLESFNSVGVGSSETEDLGSLVSQREGQIDLVYLCHRPVAFFLLFWKKHGFEVKRREKLPSNTFPIFSAWRKITKTKRRKLALKRRKMALKQHKILGTIRNTYFFSETTCFLPNRKNYCSFGKRHFFLRTRVV